MLFAWQEEGIQDIRPLIDDKQLDEALKETLLCFVLVAPNSAHVFCSRYDFGPWPLLPGVTSMPPSAWQVLHSEFPPYTYTVEALAVYAVHAVLTLHFLQAVELYVQSEAMHSQHQPPCLHFGHAFCNAYHASMEGSTFVGVGIREESQDTLGFIFKLTRLTA